MDSVFMHSSTFTDLDCQIDTESCIIVIWGIVAPSVVAF